MNVKIRAAQSAWSKPGILGAFSGKIASSWHSVLTDLHEGSNRGEYLGTVSSSLLQNFLSVYQTFCTLVSVKVFLKYRQSRLKCSNVLL